MTGGACRAYPRRTRLQIAAVVGLVSALAACGTTVQNAQLSGDSGVGTTQSGDASGLGGGAGLGAATGPAGVGTASGGISDVAGPQPTGQTGAVVGSTGAAGGTGPGSSATGGSGARAASVGPRAAVEIGIQTVDLGDGIAAASAAGNCDASCATHYQGVSQETMGRAVADWANAHGGLAGHPIKLVNYSAKTSDVVARGGAAVAAEACQFWTEDHHVVALVLPNSVTEDWYACAVKHRLPVINTDYANYVPDTQELKGNGVYNYATANFNLDLTAKYYVAALAEQKFLSAGNKVGLLYKESKIYGRVIENVMRPELKRRGLQLDAIAEWNDSTQQSAWSQYVLNFKSKGVDRVLIFGGYNFGLANFAKSAETQNYHPLYGVSSISGPNEMTVNGVPSSSLTGARGVGWWPFADVASNGDAASFNAKAAECKQIMHAAGQPWTSQSWLMEMKFCDSLFLLKVLADRAGAITAADFYAAADGLGTGYTSPYVWKTNFRRGDHNAAVYLRNLAFDSGCKCFQYTGPMYLPHW